MQHRQISTVNMATSTANLPPQMLSTLKTTQSRFYTPGRTFKCYYMGLQKTTNLTGVEKLVAGLEIKHRTPVILFRSSTTALNMWISTVNIAPITTVKFCTMFLI